MTPISFRLETNADRALNDVKDAVTRARPNLPRSIDEPMIQRVEVAGLPILTYAAIAPGKTPEQLSWFVEDIVARALQGVAGVARLERIGSVEREIKSGPRSCAASGGRPHCTGSCAAATSTLRAGVLKLAQTTRRSARLPEQRPWPISPRRESLCQAEARSG
jgi:hypothetical protein